MRRRRTEATAVTAAVGSSGKRPQPPVPSPLPSPSWHAPAAALLVFAACIISIYCVPYSKVEESFNLHALHDMIHLGAETNKYDHHEFPGVVPRTFLGSLLVTLPSKLATMCLELVNNAAAPAQIKYHSMLIARAVLASVNCLALWGFFRAVGTRFSKRIMWLTAILCAAQFHLVFYLSRTLPNTFAMPFVLSAYSFWINGDSKRLVLMFAIVVPVFRAELVALAGPVLLSELVSGKLVFWDMLRWGVPAGIVSILVSIAVDSFFWGYVLWPEGAVLYFNTIMNKSSQWGTEPVYWYFTSVIPRCLAFSSPFLPLGVALDRRLRRFVLPVLGFVALYSLLPHKELRFILYAVPLLNVACASAFDKMLMPRSSRILQWFLALVVAGIIAGTVVLTAVSTYASSLNYPGGEAMAWLHEHCDALCGNETAPASVHISNLAAQTGASRFSMTNPYFTYSKVEQWDDGLSWHDFTWLIAEQKDVDLYSSTHMPIHTINSLTGRRVTREFPFLHLITDAALVIMQRR